MDNVELIAKIKDDKCLRNQFIDDSTSFILKCAAVFAGRYIDKSDDIFSVALIAYDKAIENYDCTKGCFYSFAKTCIGNAIKDYFRAQSKCGNVVPFSSLAEENDNGDEKAFEIYCEESTFSDTALEIFSLKEELAYFGISFFDLPKCSPKSKKTKKNCVEIAEYISQSEELIKSLYRKKTLPVKQILENVKTNVKTTERYRGYIIMSVLVLRGEYEILSEYLMSK